MQIFTRIRRLSPWGRTMIATFLLSASVLSASAVTQNLLTIVFNDGQKQSYVLAEKPKVTFDASSLYVNATEVSDTYTLADVHKFVFEQGEPAAIPEISADECRLTFIDGANILLQGHKAGSSVRVIDTAGHILLFTATDDAGCVNISIADFRVGVYIIATSDGKSYKIMKR